MVYMYLCGNFKCFLNTRVRLDIESQCGVMERAQDLESENLGLSHGSTI